ncbi:hypothetical protein [Streptomyces sp. SGAir0957]
MRELYNKLPSVDDRVCNLPDPADPTEYEDVADALWDLFLTARNLVLPRNLSGCERHPGGPRDTEAPAGWGTCLICNTHRRINRPGVKTTGEIKATLWAVPDPPYSHATLMATRTSLNEAAQELEYRSPYAAFDRVADLVHSAFIIARELSRPRTQGCRLHPGAPIDPAAAGGPRCMFCVARERRAASGPPRVAVRPGRPDPHEQLLRRLRQSRP